MSNSSYIVNGKLMVNSSGNQIYGKKQVLEGCCCDCTLFKVIRERQICAGFAGVNLIDVSGETDYTLAQLKTIVNEMAVFYLSMPYIGGSGTPVCFGSDYADGAADEDALYNLVIALGSQSVVYRNGVTAIELWHSSVVAGSYEQARYDAALVLYNYRWWEYYPFPKEDALTAYTWQRAVLGYRAEIYTGISYFNPDMDFTGAPPGVLEVYAKSEVYKTGDIFDKQGYSIYDEGVYGAYGTYPTSSGWTTGVLIDMRGVLGAANPLVVPPNWQPEPPGDTGVFMGFRLTDWFAVGTWTFHCVDPI